MNKRLPPRQPATAALTSTRPTRSDILAKLNELTEAVERCTNPREASLFVLGHAVGLAKRSGADLSKIDSLPMAFATLGNVLSGFGKGKG